VQDHLLEGEILYMATDEADKAFFRPFDEHFKVRFLSDYYDEAGVSELNRNYIGMMEQVCSTSASELATTNRRYF
ncbi:unnamed protein product, partial [Sphacelaria rigidula]